MRVTFFGAARKVTGSMYLLECDDDFKILVDCGSNLENGGINYEQYTYGLFPFDPSLINLVVLTHAHVDHSGQIPNLYKYGFEGQVLCTSPTLELTEILLNDAANLNASALKNVEKSHKKSKKFKSIETEGFYLHKQVAESISNFVPIAYNQRFRFKDGGHITFYQAGHLLGAASVIFDILDNGIKKSICFSGDLGRKNFPLLPDPAQLPEVDYMVMETTYGTRNHRDTGEAEAILANIIQEACVDIPGRLIIPAFSVGRTQALLYTLNRLYSERGFQPIKVFTDSPLAKSSTKIHEKFRSYMNKTAKDFYEENESLFDFENLEYIEKNAESKSISTHSEACIIISASGMIKGGRVEYHIEQNIENPYATVLLVGFATEDSIGGRLLSGEQDSISIKGRKLKVNAKIRKTDIFSGHAGQQDLLNFIGNQNKEKLKNIFLVHGEYNTMLNFSEILTETGFKNVECPAPGQSYEL